MSDLIDSSSSLSSHQMVHSELYFLIAKFLLNGPYHQCGQDLIEQLEQRQQLPPRYDWLGAQHPRSFHELTVSHSHIPPNHLIQVCQQLKTVFERSFGLNINTLLGSGQFSLLQDLNKLDKSKQVNKLSDLDAIPKSFYLNYHSKPARGALPVADLKSSAGSTNLILNLIKKQNGARMATTDVVQTELYQSLYVHKRILGHLSAVYCVLFDRTGRLVLTGADDSLIKAWSVNEGRLMATFRGHEKEISDIDINYENTILASGSCDKTIRIWNLRTTECLTILHAHSAMVTSVEFSPYCRGSTRWLASSGMDSAVCVWEWNVNTLAFNPKPVKKCIEKSRAGAQILCLSFSPGGSFLVAGSNDQTVRVYHISSEGGKDGMVSKLTDLGLHSGIVDSIQFANNSLRFMSGSKDGTARIWRYENQSWKNITLDTSKTFAKPCLEELASLNTHRKYGVTMIAWNRDDSVAVTAQSNHVIKVWNPTNGSLIHELKGHTDEVFVLEAHPHDPRLLLSAGHDGNVILWNILTGKQIKKFYNRIENEGHGCIFDTKWSPSLNQFAATDSHGFLTLYGFGHEEAQFSRFARTPAEQFFHTDYRPLMRDQNGFVLDEQTQQLPHLMPPPFLVDADGNPYPAQLQRLVPGRELLTDLTQLTPTMVVNNANGLAEIITTDQRDNNTEEGPREQPDINNIRWVKNLVGPLDQVVLRTSENDRLESLDREETYFAQQCQKESSGSWNAANEMDYESELTSANTRRRRGRRNEAATASHNINEDSNNIMVIDNNEDSQQNYVDILEDNDSNTMDTGANYLSGGDQVPTRQRNRHVYLLEASDPISDDHASSNESSEYSDWAADDGRRGLRPPPRRTTQQQQQQPSTSRRGRRSNNNVGRPKKRVYVVEDDDDDENEEENRRLTSRQKSIIAAKRAAREAEQQQREQQQTSSKQVNYNEQDDDDEEMIDVQNSSSSDEEEYVNEEENQSSENSDDDNDEDIDPENEENRDPNKPCTSRSVAAKPKKSKRGRKPKSLDNLGKKSKMASVKGKKNASRGVVAGRNLNTITVCPPEYRPPDWLTSTVPRKSPYVPQIGDDVVYFRQGHELYVRAVKEKNIYELDESTLPWNQIDQNNATVNESNMTDNGDDNGVESSSNKRVIQVQEFCRVTGMKIEIRPPRLVCLKLSVIDRQTGTLTGVKFSIKYHDVDNVPDFVILKQFYDLAMEKNWRAKDRFRCIIDDRWYLGTINVRKPFEDTYPDSQFQCLNIEWEDGQPDMLSPWDLEPLAGGGANVRKSKPVLAADQLPTNGEEVTADELKALVYVPSDVHGVEWPEHGRDEECLRILAGLEKIMELSVAEHFNYPVDLEAFPTYAMVIPYPIDLNTIKERVANHYYRRVNSIQWDVRKIEQNAEKFNEKSSDIVRKASLLTEVLLEFINDPYCSDPMTIYKDISSRNSKLRSSTHNTSQDDSMMNVDHDDSEQEQYEEGLTTMGRRTRRSNTNLNNIAVGSGSRFNLRRRTVPPNLNETQNYLNMSMSHTTPELWWRKVCKRLINDIMKHQDSFPFRNPVDLDECPDYLQKVEKPIDLSLIRNRLNLNLYPGIKEFDEDCRQVFINSKIYNTKKNSPIYAITRRLSSLYEHKIKEIMKQQEAHLESRPSRRSRNADNRVSGLVTNTSSSRLRSSGQQIAALANSDLYDNQNESTPAPSRLRTRTATNPPPTASSSSSTQPTTSASSTSLVGPSKRFINESGDDAMMDATASRSSHNAARDEPPPSSLMSSKRFRVTRADSGTVLSYNDALENAGTSLTINQTVRVTTQPSTSAASIVNNEDVTRKTDNDDEDSADEVVKKKPVAASRKKRIDEDEEESEEQQAGFSGANDGMRENSESELQSDDNNNDTDDDDEFTMKRTSTVKKKRGRPKLESRRENNSSNHVNTRSGGTSTGAQKSTRPVRSCRTNLYDNKENDDEYQQYNGNASASGANTTNSDDLEALPAARSKRTKATRKTAVSKSKLTSRSKNSMLNSSTRSSRRSCRQKASYCELSGDEDELVFGYEEEYTQEHENSEEENTVAGGSSSATSSDQEEETSRGGGKRGRTSRRRNRSGSSNRNTSLRKRPRLAASSTTGSTTRGARRSNHNEIDNDYDDDELNENEENNNNNHNDDDRSHSSSMLISNSKSTAAAAC